MVAVGTIRVDTDANRPPHRSQRAELPHWALISGSNSKARLRPGLDNAGRGKPSINEAIHARPVEPPALARRRSARRQRCVISRRKTASAAMLVGTP